MPRALAVLLFLSLSGCTFALNAIEDFRADRYVAKGDYTAAFKLMKKVISHDPDGPRALKTARLGARVAHLEAKNYATAVEFYQLIVLSSDDVEERKSAQRFIAQIQFENLLDYDQAVTEYEKLLKLEVTPEERFRYRLNLAKSHYALNNLDQTLAELDQLLDQKPDNDGVFEAKVLKANVFMARKSLTEAAVLWQNILDEFPERSKKENVAMNLVVCYEESKELGKAIEVLEKMKTDYPNPDFLELRIQRLKDRKQNLPGAQGFRK